MKKTLATILLALPFVAVDAKKNNDNQAAAAPTGEEWQSPENLALNKERPTAYMFHFGSAERAFGVQPETSDYYKNLDGQWKFNWVASPDQRPAKFYETSYDVSGWDNIEVPGCWNVQGLQKDGTMKYGVPIYVNQPVIFYHEVKVDDWKKGVMRKAPEQWTVSKYPNEVGSYRRNFSVPADWKGRRVYVCFDGVDSFFYLWINGKYVGFSKNSRNTAKFDITDYLVAADNTLAVEVYRTSDGSFLESQDMFRLPGIYRSVYLVSEPEVKIEDLAVRTGSVTMSNDPSTASQAVITFDATIANLGKKAAKDYTINYTIKPVELYTDKVLEGAQKSAAIEAGTQKGEGRLLHSEMTLTGAKTWSAEAPYRYVCTAELKDKKGNLIDCASTYFGVCKVEIRETPANEDEFGLKGRYFYVNNKPVKLKGVNRHETSLDRGHAITRQQMEEEVMLMKRGNINHIRTSHYSNDPYMYYLCDKYGIYLEDECNIESHQYYYGEASLSHPKEWKAAHIDRNMAMVRAHVNHPSIVIWSLGNEAGPGDNFKAAYEAIKEYDQRPVQYERNNDIVDMGSNQYPSVAWVQGAVKGNYGVKYPYHISEYAHSMGNSLGNLVDYWDAIESTNFFCGGAIWDWIDQAIDAYTEDGVKYMGYGGDHGDWPNDGMFCMNGIILPDLTPKPQYFEVKKVYQNVGVKLDSVFDMHNHTMVKFTITNKNYFTSLDDYDINGIVMCDGKPVTAFPIQLPQSIGPRESFTMTVPMKIENVQGELFLNIEFRLKEAKPWARAGYVQMNEQLFIDNTTEKATLMNNSRAQLKVVHEGSATVVQGINFVASFEDSNGSLNCLQYDGEYVIESGNGLKLDAFRAPVDNDNWAWNKWFQAGLYNLQHRATAAPIITNNTDGTVSVTYTVVSQAPRQGRAIMRPGKAGAPFQKIEEGREMTTDDFHFTTTQRYTIYSDGTIALASSIVSSDPGIALPRLGYAFKMPTRFDQYEYYGRGPLNNYAARKTGSFVGRYKSTVKEQFVNFPKPQSMGNREEVRWCTLTDAQGTGLEFVADQSTMSTSALPWSALQMTLAAHPHELPKSDGTYVHLDCQVTGLGGNSCGQGGPLAQDRVQGALHQMKLIIRPVNRGANYQDLANVTCKTACPVSISRDRAGNVSITGDTREAKNICYQVTEQGSKKPGKVQTHDARSRMACMVALRNGGTVTAWYEGDDKVKTSASFEKIENVPVTVKYVSSEEGPHGELATNMVDGNPNTIWHTMYSITVPKYPHWVDFDCSEVKTIKGFTYLPRQDGPNGNIKGYKVQLSMDGENWTDAVAEGNFENNLKEKRVTFKGQKARYLRFTATSSQRGDDFASGAEFTVIAE
ncbi:MAG: discoidin domain-containing protein [Bacteroidales bacterium]|nr:discoidin domain-containing protein [Candidatus Physcousia equi]